MAESSTKLFHNRIFCRVLLERKKQLEPAIHGYQSDKWQDSVNASSLAAKAWESAIFCVYQSYRYCIRLHLRQKGLRWRLQSQYQFVELPIRKANIAWVWAQDTRDVEKRLSKPGLDLGSGEKKELKTNGVTDLRGVEERIRRVLMRQGRHYLVGTKTVFKNRKSRLRVTLWWCDLEA